MGKRPLKLIKPEKQVERDVLAWGFLNGFSLDIYDSKSLFIKGNKIRNPGLNVGTPDCCGSSPEGYSVFLELKAPGKEEVCRLSQFQFLARKIEGNCFALVLSSVSFLDQTWCAWLNLRKNGKDAEARDLLKSLLPKKVLVDGKIIAAPCF